jgi:hypothetical protein
VKLSIILSVSAIILRFITPGPGSWYIMRRDTPYHDIVETAGYETNACEIELEIPNSNQAAIYKLRFYPGSTNP